MKHWVVRATVVVGLCAGAWPAQAVRAQSGEPRPTTPRLREALAAAHLPEGLDAEQATEDADATEAAMHSLLRRARIVFAGEVLDIQALPYAMQVRFRVEAGVRGVQAGQVLVVHEWIGLWTGGQQRYTPGQRVLLFLNGTSAAGFDSPVSGQQGVVPMHGSAGEGTFDLRWIAAAAPRTGAMLQRILPRPKQSEAESYVLAADAPPELRAKMPPQPVASATGIISSKLAPENPAVSSAPGALVMGMLSAWQGADAPSPMAVR